MPAKGQLCSECSGDCCTNVRYIGDNRARALLGIVDVMTLTHRQLIALGYREEYNTLSSVCKHKTPDGCDKYKDRKALCRSYYCHGKYWKPKL